MTPRNLASIQPRLLFIELLETRRVFAMDVPSTALQLNIDSTDESIIAAALVRDSLGPQQLSFSSTSSVIMTGWAESPIGELHPFSKPTNIKTPTIFGTAEPGSNITFTGIANGNPSAAVVANDDGTWYATLNLPSNKRDYTILAIATKYRDDGTKQSVSKSERVTLHLDVLPPKLSLILGGRPSSAPLTNSIQLQFSDGKGKENVDFFDKADLFLNRDNETTNRLRATRDAQGNIIELPLLTPVSNTPGAYQLENLALATSRTGTYELKFDALTSGVADLADNKTTLNAKLTFTVDNTPPRFNSIKFVNSRAAAAGTPQSQFQEGDMPIVEVNFTDQRFAKADNMIYVVLFGNTRGPTIIRRVSYPATNDLTLRTFNDTQTQRLVLPNDLAAGTYTWQILLQDRRLLDDDLNNQDSGGHGYITGPRQSFTFSVVPSIEAGAEASLRFAENESADVVDFSTLISNHNNDSRPLNVVSDKSIAFDVKAPNLSNTLNLTKSQDVSLQSQTSSRAIPNAIDTTAASLDNAQINSKELTYDFHDTALAIGF